MSNHGDSDKWLTCPYDKSHTFPPGRLQPHILKCGKSHPEIAALFSKCRYNATHLFLGSEIEKHELSCPDRDMFKKVPTLSYKELQENEMKRNVEINKTTTLNNDDDDFTPHAIKVNVIELGPSEMNCGLAKSQDNERNLDIKTNDSQVLASNQSKDEKSNNPSQGTCETLNFIKQEKKDYHHRNSYRDSSRDRDRDRDSASKTNEKHRRPHNNAHNNSKRCNKRSRSKSRSRSRSRTRSYSRSTRRSNN
jgi:hypothetical protein